MLETFFVMISVIICYMVIVKTAIVHFIKLSEICFCNRRIELQKKFSILTFVCKSNKRDKQRKGND